MTKTVLIGLDGATFTVLNALFKSGDMPFLKSFVERGAHAEMTSTRHFISPAAWTSMVTGRTPGNHGIFDFIYCRQNPEGVYFTLNMSYDIRCPTLWNIVNQHGSSVAALNFLVTYPPQKMNGFCAPGFIHARHLRQAVHPPAFYDRMVRLLGTDTKLLSMDMADEFQAIQYLPPEDYESWITKHIQREEQWFKLTRMILREDEPDLTAVVFDGVDKLQHLCWRFLDPACFPAHPTSWERRVRDLCVEYFRAIDGFIREIVTIAEPARIFVASDHGFCATRTVFFANTWLARHGYLRWKDAEAPAESTRIASERVAGQAELIDFEHTAAFALNPSSNGIYIRRSDGRGSPGVPPDRYDAVRGRLVEELCRVTDPDTGAPFFREVLTREAAFPGGNAERAPDITLVMNDYGFLSVVKSDAVFRRRPEPWGTHHPQGIFVAGGPGLADVGGMPRMSIVDVAPILLRSLGWPAEAGMEGRVPEGLFTDPLPAASASGVFDIGVATDPGATEFDARVEAEVLKRLREMNYLE